jgi:hypothetical protein
MLGPKLFFMFVVVIPIFAAIGYFIVSAAILGALTSGGADKRATRIGIEGLALLSLFIAAAVVWTLPENPFLTDAFAQDLRNLNQRLTLNVGSTLTCGFLINFVRRSWLRAAAETR